MNTSHKRIAAALEHKCLDRIPICETAYWPETIERWHGEGLPEDTDPIDYFELDRLNGLSPFDIAFFKHEIYEETDEYIVDMSPYGTVVKYAKNGRSDSGFSELRYSVQTIEDWRKARENLVPSEDRLGTIKSEAKYKDDFTFINPVDHFWMSFRMLGLENLCVWLMQKPDEMKEIYSDYTDFLVQMLDMYVKHNPDFDAVWFFSDMAYGSGPMFSPQIFREVIAEGYKRLKQWCIDNNKYMLLHSDGNVNKLLNDLIEVGFDWIQPLEARANNDVRKMKEEFGDRITLVGNINADIIAAGDKNQIEDEIASKITVAKKDGGYIYHIDHSVPPTISFDAYSHGIEMVKKYGAY